MFPPTCFPAGTFPPVHFAPPDATALPATPTGAIVRRAGLVPGLEGVPVIFGLAGDGMPDRYVNFFAIAGRETYTTGDGYAEEESFQFDAYAPGHAAVRALVDALKRGFSPHAPTIYFATGAIVLAVPGVVGTDPTEYVAASGRPLVRMHLDIRFTSDLALA